jgi:hypothetical protein
MIFYLMSNLIRSAILQYTFFDFITPDYFYLFTDKLQTPACNRQDLQILAIKVANRNISSDILYELLAEAIHYGSLSRDVLTNKVVITWLTK